MEKPKILAYGLECKECEKLREFCRKRGVSVIKINKDEYYLPIAAAAGRLAPPKLYSGDGLPEPILVFVNFPEGFLDHFLPLLRASGVKHVSLKAVLTPFNAAWNIFELYKELSSERAALKK